MGLAFRAAVLRRVGLALFCGAGALINAELQRFCILCGRFAPQARVRSKLSLLDFAMFGVGGGGERLVRGQSFWPRRAEIFWYTECVSPVRGATGAAASAPKTK